MGIVGAGAIGNVHAETARRCGAQVSAVWDLHADRARSCAERSGGVAVGSLDELLARGDVDAVAIAVPNAAHAECAVRSFASGKHVLLEKPMAMSLAECDAIMAAARKADRVLQMGFVCRGSPTSHAAKAFVDAGRLGRIYHARCSIHRRRGIPGLGGWFTTKAQSGGGPLIDLGVHVLDLARWLCGKPKALRASGSCHTNFGSLMERYRFVDMWAGPPRLDGTFDVEDHATALVRFEGGLTVELNATWAMNIPEDALKDGIYLFGDKGGIWFSVFDGGLTLATEENDRIVDVRPLLEPGAPLPLAWDRQYRQFIDATTRGIAPHATADDGRAIQSIVEAIYRSSAEGREVEIRA